MSLSLAFVYDDRAKVSVDVQAVIGAERYSKIIHRRKTFGASILELVNESDCDDFFHITNDADARILSELILEEYRRDQLFLRFPSSYVPQNREKFLQFLSQGKFALEPVLLGPISGGEAVTLTDQKSILSLLERYDPNLVNNKLLSLQSTATTLGADLELVEVSSIGRFLPVMRHATEARSFNTISGDQFVFKKSSEDRAKMKSEYMFFHIAPEVLKPFLMPTFDFQDDGKVAQYSMERVLVPDVAVQYIHDAFDERTFSNLIDRFFHFIESRPIKHASQDEIKSVATRAVLEKLESRLSAFFDSRIGEYADAMLSTSGCKGGLRGMSERAKRIIRSAIRSDATNHLAVAHGDPCFSNILFDRRTNMMRLIDPKGATSLDEAFAHPLYDVAKFSHSVLGEYDFINNGLFECALNDKLQLELRVPGEGQRERFKSIFLDQLNRRGYNRNVVRAYELSLFLSMLPLHADHPRKLIGFSLIAKKILEQLEMPGEVR